MRGCLWGRVGRLRFWGREGGGLAGFDEVWMLGEKGKGVRRGWKGRGLGRIYRA